MFYREETEARKVQAWLKSKVANLGTNFISLRLGQVPFTMLLTYGFGEGEAGRKGGYKKEAGAEKEGAARLIVR